jgi:DinB superfamily
VDPRLTSLIAQLDNTDLDAQRLVAGLAETQCRWQPAPSRWSILDCIEHLAVSAEMYNRAFDHAIVKGKPAVPSLPPARDSLIGLWLMRNIEPPPKARIKTGRAYVPRSNAPVAEVVGRYLAAHQVTRQRIRAADGLDLVRTRMSHPSLAIFRFSLGVGFGILTGHARRHLWQARQVLLHPGFPKA